MQICDNFYFYTYKKLPFNFDKQTGVSLKELNKLLSEMA